MIQNSIEIYRKMELNKTEIPILAKPHVNYLGGNTQLYESNKITGGRKRTRGTKHRKQTMKQRQKRRTMRRGKGKGRH